MDLRRTQRLTVHTDGLGHADLFDRGVGRARQLLLVGLAHDASARPNAGEQIAQGHLSILSHRSPKSDGSSESSAGQLRDPRDGVERRFDERAEGVRVIGLWDVVDVTHGCGDVGVAHVPLDLWEVPDLDGEGAERVT